MIPLEHHTIGDMLTHIRHYLPSQAPLKDFIHHNTLHGFQALPFHEAMKRANQVFGYKTYLSLEEYRLLYQNGKIKQAMLAKVLHQHNLNTHEFLEKMLHEPFHQVFEGRIGLLYEHWKTDFHLNLSKEVHPLLFRWVAAYLDQGIAQKVLPVKGANFLETIRLMDKYSSLSIFKSKRTRELLKDESFGIKEALHLVVGDPNYWEQYLYDMAFQHPGWSGMVATLEEHPHYLLKPSPISLEHFLLFELLLEIDALDRKFGTVWKPLCQGLSGSPPPLFPDVWVETPFNLLQIWQEAYEWSFFEEVLNGLKSEVFNIPKTEPLAFQAVFCIDDRECSLRRHLEHEVPNCQTFGTAGFFNVAFYFLPEHGKFFTKVCPAPVTPVHLVREKEAKVRHKRDTHFSKHTHGLFGGWLISQTMGFVSALQLMKGIFYPSESPASVSSFRHMDANGHLVIETPAEGHKVNGLQLGFTVAEMADRVEGLLKSIGLTNDFAPIVYLIGHGASSTNNTYYAGYDCGACSGRAGSVNARVASKMANHPGVRKLLVERGIAIPADTLFIAGLHDTTRDDIQFYDAPQWGPLHSELHTSNLPKFKSALDKNALERSRRFLLEKSEGGEANVHARVRKRAFSLFEPRPEWNHATNALCLVGRRSWNRHLFLDRRAFLNSYDPYQDPDGTYLAGILRAVAPVCGGINLEYYFSRVDNARLGAGSKLPHNVVGLFGVANGMDGDLRPGLPAQMVNIHDPLRLLVIVDQHPQVVYHVLENDPITKDWFLKNWIHLIVQDPDSRTLFRYEKGLFRQYDLEQESLLEYPELDQIVANGSENQPIYIMRS